MSLFTNSENIVREIPLSGPYRRQPFSVVESNNRMFPAGSNPIGRKLYELFGNQITAQKTKEISQILSHVFENLSDATRAIEVLLAQVEVLDNQNPFKSSYTKVSNLLAWHLSTAEVLSNSSPHFLKRCLQLLFEQNPVVSKWHKDLLPETQTEASRNCLAQAIIGLGNKQSEKVIRNFKLLFSIPESYCRLTESEILALSIFTAAAKEPSGYLKKNLFSLPRTIHCDAETHDFYLLAKNKEKITGGLVIGAMKKVTFGYMLPFSPDADMEVIAELTNVHEDQANVDLLEEEANLQKQFYKIAKGQGIWPIWSVCTHTKTPSSPKISIIMPAGDGTLCQLLATHRSFPILGICKQLLLGLSIIHQSGYLQGDLKPDNVLYKALENHFMVGYIDFGFCFKPAETRVPKIFEKGFYGSVVVSPLEFFGHTDFTGDFFKVEMWAFGCLLHNLVFGVDPAWIKEVTEKYYALCVEALKQPESEDVQVTREDRKKFEKLIIEQIEVPRKTLLENAEMDPIEKQLKLLVYDCLRLDPSDRLLACDALMRILDLLKPL